MLSNVFRVFRVLEKGA